MTKTYNEFFYEKEKAYLCEYAVFSDNSKGRQKPIDECSGRTDFQRDRDRIIHSKSFRRLMHKTQCFLSPEGDHYRTRLTHTLEVSQIARTISRNLCLNEDLTEACALGHDLGHTPFGHAGERVLNQLFKGGFRHNEQSLRVVDVLERDGEGLNLTYEVREGILCHTGEKQASTLEGKLIKYADRIAYINHDIDDAIRAGVLKNEDLPKDAVGILGRTHSERIDTMVNSIVNVTKKNFENEKACIGMDEEILYATDSLRNFLFANVYTNCRAKDEEGKACKLLETLYLYFVKNIDKLPEERKKFIGETATEERVVCDYIASMTDRFAIDLYESIFVPKMWAKR